MDRIDAARLLTRALAARLESGPGSLEGPGGVGDPHDADDAVSEPTMWLERTLTSEPGSHDALRGLAASPGQDEQITVVIAQLIGRAGTDPVFAEELLRRAATLPEPHEPVAAVTQLATATEGGIALNAGGNLTMTDARLIGGDDNSGKTFHLAPGATAVRQAETTVSGRRARVFIGVKVVKPKFALLPLAFMIRVGRKAGAAAATHPVAAVAACTVVVVGGAIAVAQTPPPSLAAAPLSFAGLWQGTVAEGGKTGYMADVAITGGALQGTVGSVNLTNQNCTSTLTLTDARTRQLTISDTTASGRCPSGTLVLTPDGQNLRYTLTHADGTTATGILTRVQNFVHSATAAPAAPTTKPSVPLGQQVGKITCTRSDAGVDGPVSGKFTVPVGITVPSGAVAFEADITSGTTVYALGSPGLFCGYGNLSGTGSASTSPPDAVADATIVSVDSHSDSLGGTDPSDPFSLPAGDNANPSLLDIVDKTAAGEGPICKHSAPGCAPASSSDTSGDSGEITAPDLPVGNSSIQAFVEAADLGTGIAWYDMGVDNLTKGGLAETDGFSGGVLCSAPAGLPQMCIADMQLFLAQAAGTAVTPSALQASYAAIADFIDKHPQTSGQTDQSAQSVPSDQSGLADQPSSATTAFPPAGSTDCGVLTTTKAQGNDLVILQGSVTCARATQILTDYFAAPPGAWQGSGGFDQVDGMLCAHTSAAEVQASGVGVTCNGSGSEFQTHVAG